MCVTDSGHNDNNVWTGSVLPEQEKKAANSLVNFFSKMYHSMLHIKFTDQDIN